MRIEARKCPFTGKVFEESKKKAYIQHLAEVRKDLRAKRHVTHVRLVFHTWLAEERAKVRRVQDLPQWFMDNQRILMDAHNAEIPSGYVFTSFDEKFVMEDIFENVTINLRDGFTENVSNSHVCPDNGITNFGGEAGRPKGYPGWQGVIKGTLKRPKKLNGRYPYSNALNLAGFKTGSGGGGNENWSYEVRIFLDDWPGLQGQRDFEVAEAIRIAYEEEEDRIVRRLKNAGGRVFR